MTHGLYFLSLIQAQKTRFIFLFKKKGKQCVQIPILAVIQKQSQEQR